MADRIDTLVAELATKLGPELRKCAAEPDDFVALPLDPYMRRAKRVFNVAVEMHVGENSVLSQRASCNEANIRAMRKHPERHTSLSVVYVMDPDAMDMIADDLKAAAAEKRAMRRAG